MFTSGTLVGLAFAVLAAIPAQAAVVYSTFGSGDSYSDIDAFGVYGANSEISQTYSGSWAMKFTVPAGPSWTLDSIEVALLHQSGSNLVNVALWSDASGSPGASLESVQAAAPASASIVLVEFADTTALSAGTTYWVSMSPAAPSTDVAWHKSDPAVDGAQAFSDDDMATWNVSSSGTQAAFRVNGVPEPATLSLLVVGAAILVRRRRTTA